jgi:hypothetical protein
MMMMMMWMAMVTLRRIEGVGGLVPGVCEGSVYEKVFL